MSPVSIRRWSTLLALLAVLCGGTTLAQDNKKVQVTVVVIRASDRDDGVDPLLKCIAEEVQKHNPSLRSFSLASMGCKSLAVDEKTSFPLVEGRKADVVVHTCADKHNRVCLAITPPLQREIAYRTVCGKFLPIVTRYQTRPRVPPQAVALALGSLTAPRLPPVVAPGLLLESRYRERLILAVRVQPCNGK